MKFKRCALLFILLSCLVLSGCGGPESTYKSAQALLAKGEYAEASEKFESIGSYEDAATLTMYCKACALCESGDYEAGLKVLATLGGYKDSLYRITYYTARSYEDIAGEDDWECMLEAQDIYETIPVFLDSDERIAALGERVETAKKSQYDAAVKIGESGDFSAARLMFDHLGSYSDSKSRYTYYGIRADEIKLAESMDESTVSSVAARYTQMGAYLDCEKRAAAMQDKATSILDGKYDTAVSLMKEGRYSEAITAFTAISTHKDSEKQIQMCEIAILDAQYDAALTLKNDGKYEDAISLFAFIESHKDSVEQIKACEIAILDGKYDAAVALMNAGKYSKAITAFTQIKTHKDSVEQIKACEIAILDGKYDAAVALMNAGKYSEAITAFTKIETHKDSVEQIKACEIAILDGKYDAAVALMNAGKYSKAITAFTQIKTHKDSVEQIKACEIAILDGKYDAAVALMNAGKYSEAYDAFVALNGHNDSKVQASVIVEKVQAEMRDKTTVGSYITFGKYEQDNKTSNGKEDIEWLVLAKENDRMLVISRYALDCKPYNTQHTSVTWKTCTLRTWLNKDLLNAAFSSLEQAMIPTVTVPYDVNLSVSANSVMATKDKVFLLSLDEAEKYFKTDSERQCKATAYAYAQGAFANISRWCEWWLRSPCDNQNRFAIFVAIDGTALGRSVSVSNAIRPALWINLEH